MCSKHLPHSKNFVRMSWADTHRQRIWHLPGPCVGLCRCFSRRVRQRMRRCSSKACRWAPSRSLLNVQLQHGLTNGPRLRRRAAAALKVRALAQMRTRAWSTPHRGPRASALAAHGRHPGRSRQLIRGALVVWLCGHIKSGVMSRNTFYFPLPLPAAVFVSCSVFGCIYTCGALCIVL